MHVAHRLLRDQITDEGLNRAEPGPRWPPWRLPYQHSKEVAVFLRVCTTSTSTRGHNIVHMDQTLCECDLVGRRRRIVSCLRRGRGRGLSARSGPRHNCSCAAPSRQAVASPQWRQPRVRRNARTRARRAAGARGRGGGGGRARGGAAGSSQVCRRQQARGTAPAWIRTPTVVAAYPRSGSYVGRHNPTRRFAASRRRGSVRRLSALTRGTALHFCLQRRVASPAACPREGRQACVYP